MAEEGVPYRADTGGSVGTSPDLRAPLGEPYIIKPEDWIALQKAGDQNAAFTNAFRGASSLVDNAFNQRIEREKAQAGLAETNARTAQIGAQTDNIKSESDVRQSLLPLQTKAEALKVQQAQYGVDELGRQQGLASQAWDQYPAYRKEMNGLDFQDPDLDSKIAAIKAKYPDASTFPGTESMVTPGEQALYARRQSSTQVQYNSALTAGLSQAQIKGLLRGDMDVRAQVAAGNGPQLLQETNKSIVSNRLNNVLAYATNPMDRAFAQQQLEEVHSGGAPESNVPLFGHDGAYNAGDEAQLSALERKYGITPEYPNAKMRIVQEPNKETGKIETRYEIDNMMPTAADVQKARGQPAGAGPYNWSTDPEYKQALDNVNRTPADLNDQQRADAVVAETKRLKQAANKPWPGETAPSGPATPTAPGQGVAPTPTQGGPPTPIVPPARAGGRVPPHRRGVPISEAEEPDAGTQLAAAQPGATPPEQLAPHLGGVLSGHAQDFIAAGERHGVDPKLLAAMSIFETGNGTSRIARELNNTGGITGGGHTGNRGDYRPFNSIAQSIDEQARMIAHYQRDLGLRSIQQIGSRWAPAGGVSNDPNDTNWEWPREVSRYYNQIAAR